MSSPRSPEHGRRPVAARACFLAGAAAAFAAGATALWLSRLAATDLAAAADAVAPDGHSELIGAARIPGLQRRLAVLGGGMLLLGTAALLPAVQVRVWPLLAAVPDLVRRPARGLLRFLRQQPLPAAALALASVTMLVLGVLRLDRPIATDEAQTALCFVSRSVPAILTDYSYPNNHILHSLLAHVATGLFGHGLPALRLPALLAGVLTVPAAFAAGRALFGTITGLLAAVLVGTSFYLVDLSASARGYSIVDLCFLLLLALAPRLARHAQPRHRAAAVLVATAGLFAVPIMVIPIAIAATLAGLIALSATPRSHWPATALCLGTTFAAAGLVALLLYAPALVVTWGARAEALREIADHPQVGIAATDNWSRDGSALLLFWLHGVPVPLRVALLGSFALGCAVAWRLALATVGGTLGVVLAARMLPPPWSLGCLAVAGLLIAAAGAGAAIELLARHRPRRRAVLSAAAMAFAAGSGASTVVAAGTGVEAPWFIGYRDAEAAAAYFAGLEGPDLVITWPGYELGYYLRRAGVTRYRYVDLQSLPDGAGSIYLVERRSPPVVVEQVAALRARLRELGFEEARPVRQLPHSRILVATRP